MATRKKKVRAQVSIRMPAPLLAFYEGLSEYAGVNLDDVFNVLLALAMLSNAAPKPPP
jgi:hypothetical protein